MESRPYDILAVSSDPGSARSLIPVVCMLEEKKYNVLSIISLYSQNIFKEYSTLISSILEFEDSIDINEATKLIKSTKAKVVITGAGSYNYIEHTFRLAGLELGIPTVSILDCNTEIESRFQRWENGKKVESIPNLICVPDSQSAQAIEETIGINRGGIEVTGPPNLEESVRLINKHNIEKERLKRKWDINEKYKVVTFFSEPYWLKPDGKIADGPGGVINEKGEPKYGYRSDMILSYTIEALSSCCEKSKQPVIFILKPHPREHYLNLLPILDKANSKYILAKMIDDVDPYELLSISDIVVGMTSIALVEAALAGKASFSVQIGLQTDRIKDPCMANLMGLSSPIFSYSRLLEELDYEISNNRTEKKTHYDVNSITVMGATERAVFQILKIAG